MTRRRTLKLLHLASTAWFMLCAGYILVLALRQAGVHWWVIFSLSGYSALLIFLLTSLYLFAIFGGAARSQKIEVEHPLTSTTYYIVFYVSTPFLGSLAGCMGMTGENRLAQFLLGVALGTLGATFFVWVIVDPIAGLLEMLLVPASRKHRAERLAEAKAQREREQKDRERLLAKVFAQEELNRRRWQEALQPDAEKLAGLLTTDEIDFEQAEREAVDIGVKAWQIGGLSCMRELRDMAMAMCKNKCQDSAIIDYISTWWDGIGNWRNSSLAQNNKSLSTTRLAFF
ncbi:MAG: hypothetical protein AMJ43_10930 [Coxiella sp. DG_40]|nr:MAG: hypothetical protein AMJ43_10930 [Coxiella sp. DG_40]